MLRKMIAVVVTAVVVGIVLVPTAAAEKPTKAPAAFGEFSGQYCADFKVLIRETTNRGTMKIFSTGAAMITGTLKVEVTNLATGKTIELNISGPARFSPDGTTLVGTGAWLLFGEPGFFGPGSPRMLETNHGRLVISLVDGTILERTGHTVDLCPLLA
jgi:hypothetical protein